ncbi:hypothetical protein EYE35_11235 [Cereibacter sphaeroides]|nr:hypothetical protein EYE35_11235 [Cereibacter sphaeroides]
MHSPPGIQAGARTLVVPRCGAIPQGRPPGRKSDRSCPCPKRFCERLQNTSLTPGRGRLDWRA